MTYRGFVGILFLGCLGHVQGSEADFSLENQESADYNRVHNSDYVTDDQLADKQLENFLEQDDIDAIPDIDFMSFQEHVDNRLIVLMGDGIYKQMINSFSDISLYLTSVRSIDIHVLDPYVIRAGNRSEALLTIGRQLNIDDGALTLAQVGQQMSDLVKDSPFLFEDFRCEEKSVSSADLQSYLSQHFTAMDGEIMAPAINCPQAREIWSRTWTLAITYYEKTDDFLFLKLIYDKVCENYLTGGRCIEGRINRGFLGYVSLLSHLISAQD